MSLLIDYGLCKPVSGLGGRRKNVCFPFKGWLRSFPAPSRQWGGTKASCCSRTAAIKPLFRRTVRAYAWGHWSRSWSFPSRDSGRFDHQSSRMKVLVRWSGAQTIGQQVCRRTNAEHRMPPCHNTSAVCPIHQLVRVSMPLSLSLPVTPSQ